MVANLSNCLLATMTFMFLPLTSKVCKSSLLCELQPILVQITDSSSALDILRWRAENIYIDIVHRDVKHKTLYLLAGDGPADPVWFNAVFDESRSDSLSPRFRLKICAEKYNYFAGIRAQITNTLSYNLKSITDSNVWRWSQTKIRGTLYTNT